MPTIETLMIANHAEARDGMLYVMGGGWTENRRPVTPGQPIPATHLAIAATVLVGWTETNREHVVTITIESEDGGPPLLEIQNAIVAGRAPDAVEGADTRAVMALTGEVMFPHPGGYQLVARLEDGVRSASFRVIDVPVAPTAPTA